MKNGGWIMTFSNNNINDDNTNNNNSITTIDNSIIPPDTPQVPIPPDIPSNSTPVRFSTSDKADREDAEIERIRQYLLSQRAPPDLPADALTCFIRRAHRFLIARGCLWRKQHHSRHQLYAHPSIRYTLVHDAHDWLGHKGFYSTHRTLLDCFWWPALDSDIKWYVQTCHQCQIHQTTKVRLPPTIDDPAPLFRKAHIDTMYMLHAGGYRYIVQARCSLTAWPEWRALCVETGHTIGAFIFEEILCRWGAVEQIVTDNGTAYVVALDWLAERYGIHHICISPYNSQANGVIERQHCTVRKSIFKACNGDDSHWPTVAPFTFWADRATVCKSTSYSPFYMAHGVEPTLPFDISEATFLVSDLTQPLSTQGLLATHACQPQKHPADLTTIHDCIAASRHASACQFKKHFANTIRNYDFAPGSLVLIRNTLPNMDKMKPRYLGPMVFLRRTRNGAYHLSELNSMISRLHYAAFRLIPYHARSRSFIPVTHIVGSGDLASLELDDAPATGPGLRSDESTQEGQILNPPGGVRSVYMLASETSHMTCECHF